MNQRKSGLMFALSTEADESDKENKDGTNKPEGSEGGEEGKGKDDKPADNADDKDGKKSDDKPADDNGEKKPEGEGKPEGDEGKGADAPTQTDADQKPEGDGNATPIPEDGAAAPAAEPVAEPAAEPAAVAAPAEGADSGAVAEGGEGTPGLNDATPQFDPDDQGPLDVAVDPDHPETIEGLSLVEYAHLFRFEGDGAIQEDTDQVLATESFSEHWQNFKNRFEMRMSNEEAYIDHMLTRLKEKMPAIQAATDKAPSNVPISIFANVNWFQLDNGKMLNSAQAIIQQLERLIELNVALETDWVPVYTKAIKGMIDILALGANDVDSAYDKAYVMEASFPTPKLAALMKHPHAVKVGSGKTVAGFRTDPYPGSWYLVKYEVPDGAEKGVKRGEDYYAEHNGAKPAGKVQLKPATRDEMKKIVELSIKLCEIMDRTVDLAMDAGAKMLVDKINNFENHHQNWRKYPKEERQKIAGVLNAADNVLFRSWITADSIDGTRMPLRAFERFVDMSLARLK